MKPNRTLPNRPLAASAAVVLLLTACASPGARDSMSVSPDFDAVAAVTAIRAVGTASGGELDVQPLRDPRVTDLLEQARALEAGHLYRAAAERLDQALAINPDDPNVLQHRAETALLLGETVEVEQLALRAVDSGTQVGPLCRQHWETVLRARQAMAPPEATDGQPGIDEATRNRDACTVAPPPRY
jgi:hypothetical protein